MKRTLFGADAADALENEIRAAGDEPGDTRRDQSDFVPVVWLIGKVQSGKTSVVAAMTDLSDAEVGNGFQACTRHSRMFDFPPDKAMLRFLDTRGIGEVGYDPAEDIAVAEQQAHVLLVTMRAMDVDQRDALAVVSTARRRHPDWPVIVAQTTLHEGYERGQRHVMPYPFDISTPALADTVALPADLLRCLRVQREQMARLPGGGPIVFVPLDFTKSSDAMPPPTYGLDALGDALVRVVPEVVRGAVEALPGVAFDPRQRAAEPVIMAHALAAAGSDLVPLAGGFAVTAAQARLLHALGRIYATAWDRRSLVEFSVALGSGVAMRTALGMGARQLAKLIPGIGQTVIASASAGTSFAVTYAMGKAAVYFLTRRRRGLSAEGTAAAYRDALRHAFRMARERTSGPASRNADVARAEPRRDNDR